MPSSGVSSEALCIMKIRSFKQLFAGLLLLSAVVYAATHYGEFIHFIGHLRSIHPAWLFVALLLQTGTQVSLASVWYRTLQRAGVGYQLRRIILLAVAKLFTDKVVPSGGISGIAFAFNALHQREVPGAVCMRVMLIDILSYYTANILSATGALLLLWQYHDIQRWMVVAAAIFVVWSHYSFRERSSC